MERRRVIEVGEQIGTARVVGRVYNEARKEWEYLCRCVCGAEFKSRKDHLLHERKGCASCMGKGKVRLNLEGTISEEEFEKRVQAKICEKNAKKALAEKVRQDKIIEKQKRNELLEREKQKKKEIFARTRLTHPCWIGEKFDRLTVIDTFFESGFTYWVCQCDCGSVITRKAKGVKFGHYRSCGCKSKDIARTSYSYERLHSIWCGMKDRCLNKNNNNYHNYGGRGITMCKEWKESYLNFRKWAYENGWTETTPLERKYALSIERKNVNGNYEPSNCCFIEMRLQCLNKRPYSECNKKRTKKDITIIKIGEEEKSLREWQEFYGISDNLLRYRTKVLNLSIEDSLKTPKHDTSVMYKAYQ